MTSSPEDTATYVRAQRTVIGVQAAKAANNRDDVNFLIQTYLTEEMELGRPLASAWTMLFSASTNWLDALMAEDAERHGVSKAKRINEWSMKHAMDLT